MTITNPDAETGDTIGWTDFNSSGMAAVTSKGSITGPHAGTYFFTWSSSPNPPGLSYQIIDLSTDLSDFNEIDAERVVMDLSIWAAKSAAPENNDAVDMVVEFLDASDAVLSNSIPGATDAICPEEGNWRQYTRKGIHVPSGTRKLKLWLAGNAFHGGSGSVEVGVDDLDITLRDRGSGSTRRVAGVYFTDNAARTIGNWNHATWNSGTHNLPLSLNDLDGSTTGWSLEFVTVGVDNGVDGPSSGYGNNDGGNTSGFPNHIGPPEVLYGYWDPTTCILKVTGLNTSKHYTIGVAGVTQFGFTRRQSVTVTGKFGPFEGAFSNGFAELWNDKWFGGVIPNVSGEIEIDIANNISGGNSDPHEAPIGALVIIEENGDYPQYLPLDVMGEGTTAPNSNSEVNLPLSEDWEYNNFSFDMERPISGITFLECRGAVSDRSLLERTLDLNDFSGFHGDIDAGEVVLRWRFYTAPTDTPGSGTAPLDPWGHSIRWFDGADSEITGYPPFTDGQTLKTAQDEWTFIDLKIPVPPGTRSFTWGLHGVLEDGGRINSAYSDPVSMWLEYDPDAKDWWSKDAVVLCAFTDTAITKNPANVFEDVAPGTTLSSDLSAVDGTATGWGLEYLSGSAEVDTASDAIAAGDQLFNGAGAISTGNGYWNFNNTTNGGDANFKFTGLKTDGTTYALYFGAMSDITLLNRTGVRVKGLTEQRFYYGPNTGDRAEFLGVAPNGSGEITFDILYNSEANLLSSVMIAEEGTLGDGGNGGAPTGKAGTTMMIII